MVRRICLALVLVVTVVVAAAIATGGAPSPSVTPRPPCVRLVAVRPGPPTGAAPAGACRLDHPEPIDV